MAVKANELVKYMEAKLFALSSDVGWIGEEEIARAINDGRVRHAPISIYRQEKSTGLEKLLLNKV